MAVKDENKKKKVIHFMGILSNVDSSLLKMNFEHGFEIKEISLDDYTRLIYTMFRIPPMKVYEDIGSLSFIVPSESKLLFISNSFESETMEVSELIDFEGKFLNNYLRPLLRLMRLFKEGNICMPVRYYYSIDNHDPKGFASFSEGGVIPREIFILQKSELAGLKTFLQQTKLPFVDPIQLAFENFELSYRTLNSKLAFLSLMISQEILLNPADHELRYRVSRNTATLLGGDKDEAEKIFSDMKNLYDKRSRIVHFGKKDSIDGNDLLKLRDYVRRTIKEVLRIDKSKDDLLQMLNSSGFGERPWIK